MIKRQQVLNGCQTTILRNNTQQIQTHKNKGTKLTVNDEESNTCVSLLLTAPHDDAGKMLRSGSA